MDVGIIAASLIVMRPCLQAISSAVSKRCHFRRISFARKDPHNTPSPISRLLRAKGIVRTVDFELESQPISTREITPKDLL